MAKKDQLKTFQVYAQCRRYVSVPVQAKSLEEAVTLARQLSEDEFVTVNGDYMDGETEIQGVLQ